MLNSELLKVRFCGGGLIVLKITSGKCAAVISEISNLPVNEVSGAGDLPPCALSDPDLNLSAHPAPIIQPSVLQTTLPFSQVPPINWLTSESG